MSRRNVYYWKCDRPAAFHGTAPPRRAERDLEPLLHEALTEHFNAASLRLTPADGQGNHLTWRAELDGLPLFVRVENGPEGDDYIEMETFLLRKVASVGVPAPKVYACDGTRQRVPFAWQALQDIPHPDLNHWHKRGTLDSPATAFEIGRNVARWQSIKPEGFGPFCVSTLRDAGQLRGLHTDYAMYFRLRLADHLDFLVKHNFLRPDQRREIFAAIDARRDLLALTSGCLVHKDLALWNVLGSETRIAAFIDFDDAISGDPMDDLSLLACFHDAAFLRNAFAGYKSVHAPPPNHRERFWLHLLRNLIVKAVIRVGSGYFDQDDRHFLIGPGQNGEALKQQTEERIAMSLHGLATDAGLSILDADFCLP
jgi:fructosamine-3-kinase